MERIRGGWKNVPKHLKCKSNLKELGLIPAGEVKAEVWNGHIWVKLYDISETTPRKLPTDKQLEAVKKARDTQVAARTCSRCGEVASRKEHLYMGMCRHCHEDVYIEDTSKSAFKLLRSWVNDKSKYLILDTETTGLDYDSEIVDIAIIDLDENVLFESLVKPISPIPEEASAVHGITNKMVVNAPSWSEVWPLIKPMLSTEKTILIYNADFDISMIRNNCKRYNLPYTPFKNICVMKTYAKYVGSYSSYHQDFTWISLMDAAYDQDIRVRDFESHRAKADCITCARLIRQIVENRVV